jgi:hypothetical protein
MEDLILGLFIGIPAALLLAALAAWYRTRNQYQMEEP